MNTKQKLEDAARILYWVRVFGYASIPIVLFILVLIIHGALCSGSQGVQDLCSNGFWSMTIGDWVQTIMLFLTLAAILSARHLAEMKLVYDYLGDYANDDMRKAARCVGEISLPTELKQGIRTSERHYTPLPEKEHFTWTSKQDAARRKVKMYYFRVLKLYKDGFITKNVLCMMADHQSFALLFSVIEPMEYCLNPDYDKDPFAELMSLCGEYYIKYSKAKINTWRIVDKELGENDGSTARKA
ncbi:MAG: hypothetical protein Q4F30_07265 [Akkermansia sp.]|nr:hypothetical protein [Akkermansia sp.]